MSAPNDSTSQVTSTGDDVSLSSSFLDFRGKVRSNDPSILPLPGESFKIRNLSERENIELADALLENTSVTYLELDAGKYTKRSVEAMAKYIRTSKRLQRIYWLRNWMLDEEFVLRYREEMFCCFLPAIQECTSLKELDLDLPPIGGPSILALENMLKTNTTLRELTLVWCGATTASPILTSLRDHPLLRRLCLRGYVTGLDRLEAVLLSDTSKITELEIEMFYRPHIRGMTRVLQALARRPTLTKLGLRRFPLGREEARELGMALRNIPSLHNLAITITTLGSAGLAELAPALYRNTSIKALDISGNDLNDMESAEIIRDIMRRNKTITTLDLSRNNCWQTTGAVTRIADGLGSNSTLLKIDLSSCALGDVGVSALSRNLGSRNTTLQKLSLNNNSITSTGVGVLLETMEQNSHHITDLELGHNFIRNEGAILLARSLGNNALPNLTHLSLSSCGINDDGFIALVSALEQSTSLLHLDLCRNHCRRERAFLALAESLPEIKVLQRVDIDWSPYLASAMPQLLEGLSKNTSLFRFHVPHCASSLFPHSSEQTARLAGGWMQEMERLGYRNSFRLLTRAPKERLPPRGVWPLALTRAATLPDAIFEVLRSKPTLR
jgi:Ran GTPase-activating protein (RanGAP) involved in mRNA processing and transport